MRPLLCLGVLCTLSITSVEAVAQLSPLPETHPHLTVETLRLEVAEGTRLSVIVTRPPRREARLPAILFVQWLSCDTVALPPRPSTGWEIMLERVVRESGALVWRTEKRGVGGGDGSCGELDYETELSDHRAALAALRRRTDVDPNRIIIFGASMGATMAPLLAEGDDRLAGVAVWGGGTRSWAERTLAFERNRLELAETPIPDRLAEITARYRLIHDVIILGRSPADAAAAAPELRGAWERMAGTRAESMYGRPLAFHRQAQRRDWASAWSRVRAPVLAMLGEHDWFEDAGSALLIGEVVNRGRPGTATVAIVPGLDHHFSRFPDRGAAFQDREGIPDPAPALATLLPWLRERFEQ